MALDDRADTFLRMIRRAQRGRLKIYLGYCAGVGKTYQMLQEGHRIKEEGIDVVIGLVVTHGRIETERLVEGLEVIPGKRQEYRGITVEEMDVDAILARKPQVVLIDELAHTNVPGSRNMKRYQDVQDVLAAGIHVITTLNLQHLESLYDTVEKAVGVKVRERLPDTVIAEADQIVNVDLTPEDLRKRLAEGKVYTQERIEVALEHFFRTSNLEKLRELTLRELASQIDLRRRETPEDENHAAPDQVMVCLSSRGPNSETLLRYASRLAGRLNRNWYAVYVQTPSEEPTVIDAHTQRIVSDTLTLAKQLGALAFTFKGQDIADTILHFAKEYRVGHIVIGNPRPRSFWQRLQGKESIVGRLIHDAKGVTITILDTRQYEAEGEKALADQKVEFRAPAPESHLLLSSLLSPRRVLIWDHPIEKEAVLRDLVGAAASDSRAGDSALVLDAVLKREEQGSTFMSEGVAFPHARLDHLDGPVIALGLTRWGVADVETEKPIELVVLILSPAETPDTQIRILGLISRASRDRSFLQNLKAGRTPGEVLDSIRDWELSQNPNFQLKN
jgi:two-component system, OmpR family, sensor histidine kinase KdpD